MNYFYGFILSMWVMGNVSEDWVKLQKEKGRITQEEMEFILSTPQNKSKE